MAEIRFLHQFCLNPRPPKEITQAAYDHGGVQLNMQKVFAKMDKLRTVNPSLVPEGLVMTAEVNMTFQQLINLKILKSVKDQEIETLLEHAKNKRKINFTFSYSKSNDLEVVIVFNESAAKVNVLKRL